MRYISTDISQQSIAARGSTPARRGTLPLSKRYFLNYESRALRVFKRNLAACDVTRVLIPSIYSTSFRIPHLAECTSEFANSHPHRMTGIPINEKNRSHRVRPNSASGTLADSRGYRLIMNLVQYTALQRARRCALTRSRGFYAIATTFSTARRYDVARSLARPISRFSLPNTVIRRGD